MSLGVVMCETEVFSCFTSAESRSTLKMNLYYLGCISKTVLHQRYDVTQTSRSHIFKLQKYHKLVNPYRSKQLAQGTLQFVCAVLTHKMSIDTPLTVFHNIYLSQARLWLNFMTLTKSIHDQF